jgi:hypothetical protein
MIEIMTLTIHCWNQMTLEPFLRDGDSKVGILEYSHCLSQFGPGTRTSAKVQGNIGRCLVILPILDTHSMVPAYQRYAKDGD